MALEAHRTVENHCVVGPQAVDAFLNLCVL